MYHALAYYTRIESLQLLDFRNKYDPTVDLMDDHISIIFPVSDEISKEQITSHIQSVLSHWKPFEVHVNGYIKSWDHWLFLTIGEGNEKVIELYNDMLSGILIPYFRADPPFIPHISIGYVGQGQFDVFNSHDELDVEKYRITMSELGHIEIDFWRKIDKLTMVSINDELTELKDVREFEL
jgi:2'-5' RNA ligase